MDKVGAMPAFSTGRLDFMDKQHIMMGLSTRRAILVEKWGFVMKGLSTERGAFMEKSAAGT